MSEIETYFHQVETRMYFNRLLTERSKLNARMEEEQPLPVVITD
ncbi:hypothetical protein MITS9509_01086 [Synechococcus sp. MIT S9509]|nr:hypothetical protein MITS9504_00651 [Synechococcus sp. MIT S9504]KZR92637.1 hypothetical protein MITS9509_01086 [Synechococcus sp. MIT S9509]